MEPEVDQKIKIKEELEASTEICNEHISNPTLEIKKEIFNKSAEGQDDRIKDEIDGLTEIYQKISDNSKDNEQIDESQAVVVNRNLNEITIENETLIEYIVSSSPHEQGQPKSSPVECDICGDVLLTRNALFSHRYRKHKDVKRVKGQTKVCPFCSRVLKSARDLQQHIDSLHSDTIHNCPYCDHNVPTRNALYQHIVRKHRDIKRRNSSIEGKCSQCGEIFESLRKLKSHRAIHRVRKGSVSEANLWFQCKDCGHKLKSKRSLYTHRFRKHRKENKCLYQCGYCELMLPSYLLLQKHQLNSHKDLTALKQSVDKL